MDYSQSYLYEQECLKQELRRLRTERNAILQCNGTSGYGYDPAVGAVDAQVSMVQTKIRTLENAKTPALLRLVLVYDTENNFCSSFMLISGPGGEERDGYTLVNREAAFGCVLATCVVGDDTDFGMVVSVDGSPVLSKAERDEILRIRIEQVERGVVREQRRAAEQRRRAAKQRRRVDEEHTREAAEAAERRRVLIAEAEAERRKEEAVAELEAKAVEERRIAVAEAAESDAERVKLAREKAAVRIALVRERVAKKREHARVAWLEDQRAKAESLLPLSLEEARRQVSRLKALGGSAMLDGVAVSDRAEILYIRCRKSHEISDAKRPSVGGGAFVEGLLGFLAKMVAGPVGAVVRAGDGAALGYSAKGGFEKGDWTELLTTLKVLAARPL